MRISITWLTRSSCVISSMLVALLVSSADAELVVMDQAVHGDPFAVSISPSAPTAQLDNKIQPSAAAKLDLLELVNGDSLHGTLVSVKPSEYGLRWKHVSADNPIDFTLNAVAKVKLGTRQVPVDLPHNSRVRLTNSDQLSGDLISLSDTDLALNTWYAGPMTIKRPMLKMLEPNLSSSPIIYKGPKDIHSWTIRTSAASSWKYKKGAVYSSSSYPIGRVIDDMPDMANIKFDVAWQSGYPSFYFSFFSDNLASYQGNCHALRVQSTSVYLYRYTSGRGSNNLNGNANVQSLSTVKSATFNILADRKKRKFTLLSNGVLIKQWTDAGASPGPGKGIVFDPESNHPMKVSNISITKWDGSLPTGRSEAEIASKEDTILFINEDKVSGRLESITEGIAKLETSYAALDIPLSRVSRIDMSSEAAEQARRNATDIRAHLPESGVVTIGLIGIENNQVEGSSENFGMTKMPLSAFDVLEFNIYRDNADGEDDSAF
jgi:hypothetical protein